jgi:outer membrane protein TolC
MRSYIFYAFFFEFFLAALLSFHPAATADDATADSAKHSLTLEELRQHALVHSEAVKRISSTLSEKVAESLAIEQLQNPQLQGSFGVPTSYGTVRPEEQLQLTLSQSLRASDFGTRTELSKLIRSVASREQQMQLQAYFAKLTISYNALWAFQIEEKHLKEQLAWGEKVVRLLSEAEALGRFSLPQKQMAEASVEKTRAELLGLAHSQAVERSRLTRLSGKIIEHTNLEKVQLRTLPEISVIWRELEQNESSLLKRYQLWHQLNQEQLHLAKQDRFSAFQPQIGYTRNEDGDHFVGVGFSVALPLFQRNEADIGQRRAQLDASQATLSYLRSNEFKEEFRLLVEGVTAKIKQAETYERTVVPGLKKVLESSEDLFKNGQLTLLELWKAKTEYHDAQDESMAVWGEALALHVELAALCGWSYF